MNLPEANAEAEAEAEFQMEHNSSLRCATLLAAHP